VNMKYGNEAEIMWHYSHAAILIDVLPRRERSAGGISGLAREGKRQGM
jgi:hypothetical protein